MATRTGTMATCKVTLDTAGLQAWLDAEVDALAWIEPDGRYRIVNRAMARLLGCPSPAAANGADAGEWLGRTLGGADGGEQLRVALANRPAAPGTELTLTLTEPGPPPRELAYQCRPILAGDEFLGWRETIRDVTDLREEIRAKDEWVARISHELRTPMTAILGFCHMLLNYSGDLRPAQRQYVNKVLKNASVLLQLLNNILDMARMHRGQVPVTPETVDLRVILDEVLETIEPQTWERPIRVRVETVEVTRLVTDRLKLKQILINLVSNAVNYTPAGEVVIAARAVPEGVALSVSDTGPGIPPEVNERIFEPYFQVAAQKRFAPSTGLGLAICRRMTDLLEGQLSVVSEVGRGSTFTLTLPTTIDRVTV